MDSVPSSLKQGARAALSAKEELGAAALPSWRPCALGLALLGRTYRTVDSDPVAAQWAAQANVQRSAIEELGRSGWARMYRAASAHAQGPCTGTHGVGAVGASRAELPKTAQPGVVSSGASKSPAETAFEIAKYMSPVGHDFIPF
jgi:hypothetical protein